MKSRLCCPSSKTSGALPFSSRDEKIAATPGVRVGQRLARPVDVEEPQRDRRDAVGAADDEEHLLVVALADRVDRGRGERLRLRSSAAARAARRSSGRAAPSRAPRAAPPSAAPGTTRPCSRRSVERPRRRSTSTRRRPASRSRSRLVRQHLEHDGAAERVDVDCSARSRTSTGRRRPPPQVHDAVDARRRARTASRSRTSPRTSSAPASGSRAVRRVHLRDRASRARGPRGRREQRVDEVRADEAGAAGDERPHARDPSPRGGRRMRAVSAVATGSLNCRAYPAARGHAPSIDDVSRA